MFPPCYIATAEKDCFRDGRQGLGHATQKSGVRSKVNHLQGPSALLSRLPESWCCALDDGQSCRRRAFHVWITMQKRLGSSIRRWSSLFTMQQRANEVYLQLNRPGEWSSVSNLRIML